jgi:hypothetical protein
MAALGRGAWLGEEEGEGRGMFRMRAWQLGAGDVRLL